MNLVLWRWADTPAARLVLIDDEDRLSRCACPVRERRLGQNGE